jgi:hypothetical protein
MYLIRCAAHRGQAAELQVSPDFEKNLAKVASHKLQQRIGFLLLTRSHPRARVLHKVASAIRQGVLSVHRDYKVIRPQLCDPFRVIVNERLNLLIIQPAYVAVNPLIVTA